MQPYLFVEVGQGVQLMSGEEAEWEPMDAYKEGSVLWVGYEKTEQFQGGRISPMDVLKAEDRRRMLSEGSDD